MRIWGMTADVLRVTTRYTILSGRIMLIAHRLSQVKCPGLGISTLRFIAECNYALTRY